MEGWREGLGSSGTDTSGSSILGQLFSSSGLPSGGEFQINTGVEEEVKGRKTKPLLWIDDPSGVTEEQTRKVARLRELLGLDPLYVACEGRLVAVVAAGEADDVVNAMRAHPLG